MRSPKQQWLILRHTAPVAESLQRLVYSSEQSLGFELMHIKQGSVWARFIERIEVEERVSDPYGDYEEVVTVKYVYFDFSVVLLGDGFSLVKILRPPASLKSFIRAVSSAFEFNAFLGKVCFDLLRVYKVISESGNIDRLVISKVSASQIPLSDNSVAKVEIASETNAFLELKEKFKSPLVRLDRLAMSGRMNFKNEDLEISSAGSIYCTEGFEAILQDVVLRDINLKVL